MKTWKTVKLGTGLKTSADFKLALEKGGHNFNSVGVDVMLRQLDVSIEEIEVDLVEISGQDLGLGPISITMGELWSAAHAIGLHACPREIGPQLCLQCELPNRKTYHVVMDEIYIDPNSKNTRWRSPIWGAIFMVHRGTDTPNELGACHGSDGSRFAPTTQFIFMKPRE